MRACVLVLVVLFTCSPALAQTTVSAGPIAGAATWMAAGSPYTLAGDISVPEGASLRIEAGVEVRAPASGTLTISGGRLEVVGTADRPVVLRSTTPGTRWQGIVATTGTLELEHAQLVDATVAIDTDTGGALRFVTVAVGSSIEVRGGNLSFRDSDVYSVRFRDTGTTSTFRTIFRGAVIFGGDRAFVDHATFLSDVTGSGGADIADSIIVQPRQVDCPCVLDRVLIAPRSRGETTVTVTEERGDIAREAALLSTELRPTSRSPARLRGSAGSDLGARAFAGEPTARLEGWLWDGHHMTRDNREDIAGDLTVPAGQTFTVDPGVSLSFPFGADELEYELRVHGTMVWGAASGPRVELGGTPTRRGTFPIVVTGADASLSMTHVRAEETRVEASLGARIVLTDVELAAASPCVVAGAGTRSTLSRVRCEGTLELAGHSEVVNLRVVGGGTALLLTPGTGESVTVRHATLRGRLEARSQGIQLSPSGSGTVSIVNTAVTGWSFGVVGISTGLSMATSVVGGNTMDLAGITAPPSVRVIDPLLDASGLPRAGSPCIDAADDLLSDALDIDGVARPVDGDGAGGARADIGAFEVGLGSCGNAILEPGERCDDGAMPGYGWEACARDCRGHGPFCGDGVISGPELCDGEAGCSSRCDFSMPDAGALLADAGSDDAGSGDLDGGSLPDAQIPDLDAGAGVDGAGASDGALAVDALAEHDARAGAGIDAGIPAATSGCACRATRASCSDASSLVLGLVGSLATVCRARRGARRSRRA